MTKSLLEYLQEKALLSEDDDKKKKKKLVKRKKPYHTFKTGGGDYIHVHIKKGRHTGKPVAVFRDEAGRLIRTMHWAQGQPIPSKRELEMGLDDND